MKRKMKNNRHGNIIVFGLCGMLLSLFSVNTSFCDPELENLHLYGGDNRDECMDHIITSDGGYALFGWSMSWRDHGSLFWLLKIDENGDSLWSKTYGTEGWNTCHKGFQTEDDGFILIGYSTQTLYSDANVLIVKTNSDGDSLWSKTYGGPREDKVFSAIRSADGGYSLAGHSNSWNEGQESFYFLKLDEDFDSLWSNTYGTTGIEVCKEVIQNQNNEYVLAGDIITRFRGSDFLVVFVSEEGDSLRSFNYGSRYGEIGNTINEVDSAKYVISGYTSRTRNSQNQQISAVCLNDRGHTLWLEDFGVDSLRYDEIALSSFYENERLYLSGYFEGKFGLISIDVDGNLLSEQYWEAPKTASCYSILKEDENTFSLTGYCGWFTEVGERIVNAQDYFYFRSDLDLSIDNFEMKSHRNLNFFVIQSYPNPFNSLLTITINMGKDEIANLNIYDINGRKIKNSMQMQFTAGRNSFYIDAAPLPNGVYFLNITNNRFNQTSRIEVLK